MDNLLLAFKKPDFENITEYSALYSKFSKNLLTCEGVPSTLLLWEPFYNQSFAIKDNSLFVRFETEKNNCFFLLPFSEDFEKSLNLLEAYAKANNIPLCLLAEQGERLEAFRLIFGDRYNITEIREDFEYIYSAELLKTLPGKKLHSKRNHISAFSRKYSWSYEALEKSNLDEVFKMADIWAESMETEEERDSVLSESAAMKRVLPFMDSLEISGGVLRVDGEVVAFCFGAPINDRVFDVQVEKALPEFREAYSVINREFVAHLPQQFIYINREDDMGIEGLRKAKLSYKPEILLKKYFITPNISPKE